MKKILNIESIMNICTSIAVIHTILTSYFAIGSYYLYTLCLWNIYP